jgi:soluble lytic murein transglycosylase-like protein
MITNFAIHDVPVACINQAAIEYHVPALIIVAVLETENGANGFARPNPNGTYDYGPMQINSLWLQQLRRYGITAHDLRNDPCVNVKVGAWILGQKIASADTLWRGVANYHSTSEWENYRYRSKIAQIYRKLKYTVSHG